MAEIIQLIPGERDVFRIVSTVRQLVEREIAAEDTIEDLRIRLGAALTLNASTTNQAQDAIDYIANDLDPGEFQPTIQLADGTYGKLSLRNYLAATSGDATQDNPTILGNVSNPQNVIIDGGAGSGIELVNVITPWIVNGVTAQATGGGAQAIGINVDAASRLYLKTVRLGAATTKVNIGYGAWLEHLADVTDIGNATTGIVCAQNSTWLTQSGKTWTFSGTPVYGSSFIALAGCSTMTWNGTTFSGTFTGVRMRREFGCVVNTGGTAPDSFFPGSLPSIITPAAIIEGGTGGASAAAARTNLGLQGQATHGDSDYTILAADLPLLVTSASLTAARTWTLPAASAVSAGRLFTISDQGGINGANTLTIQRGGSDTFQGVGVAANAITLSAQFNAIQVYSNGVNAWYLIGLR